MYRLREAVENRTRAERATSLPSGWKPARPCQSGDNEVSPQIIPQLPGVAGVRQGIRKMISLTNESITDPVIRDQAASAISGCPRGDRRCQCYALLAWVKRKMHYVADPRHVEAFHTPSLIARAIHSGRYVYGDCDDFSMYLAALMKSIGLQPAFRAVGYDGRAYQHVYVTCQGMKLDATRDEWNAQIGTHFQETSVMEYVV